MSRAHTFLTLSWGFFALSVPRINQADDDGAAGADVDSTETLAIEYPDQKDFDCDPSKWRTQVSHLHTFPPDTHAILLESIGKGRNIVARWTGTETLSSHAHALSNALVFRMC